MNKHKPEEELHTRITTTNLWEKIRMRRMILKYKEYTLHHEKDEFTLHKELKELEHSFYQAMGFYPPIEE